MAGRAAEVAVDDTLNRHHLAKPTAGFSWSATSCRGCCQTSRGWFRAANRQPHAWPVSVAAVKGPDEAPGRRARLATANLTDRTYG